MIVNINDIVDGLELQNEESTTYLIKATGKVEMIPDEIISAIEDEDESAIKVHIKTWGIEWVELAKDIVNNPDNYLSIPSQFEVHEYKIIERYCDEVEDKKLQEKLYLAIRGSGAFRRFKDTLAKYDKINDWYEYRQKAFKEIAIEWCKVNDLQYI